MRETVGGISLTSTSRSELGITSTMAEAGGITQHVTSRYKSCCTAVTVAASEAGRESKDKGLYKGRVGSVERKSLSRWGRGR